jgi:Type II secretion system (T2SS), protein M subtype b
MIWREKRVLLLVLAVLVLGNVVFFFTYRVQYQSRLNDLDTRLEQAEARLEEVRRARASAERTLEGFRAVEKDVALVYDDYWSTEGRRLAEMIGEVKRLAVASSLVPTSYTFTRCEAAGGGEAQKKSEVGAVEVGVQFVVTGTYEQVRRLINLLELSRQFVIIDQISLAAAEGDQLTLNLHLKTLFRDASVAAPSKNRL